MNWFEMPPVNLRILQDNNSVSGGDAVTSTPAAAQSGLTSQCDGAEIAQLKRKCSCRATASQKNGRAVASQILQEPRHGSPRLDKVPVPVPGVEDAEVKRAAPKRTGGGGDAAQRLSNLQLWREWEKVYNKCEIKAEMKPRETKEERPGFSPRLSLLLTLTISGGGGHDEIFYATYAACTLRPLQPPPVILERRRSVGTPGGITSRPQLSSLSSSHSSGSSPQCRALCRSSEIPAEHPFD
ncbi:hypothetical protein EYF80_011252 [Liparis tanakae]|uniref:Uncharacterized protein n=1 Tax=Liparis tanakae TaxID=230148 RepID=A0A4Z2IKF2_9TELE|nr:hypothetical protein EYF80_011252 [Liparis tanakae]